MRLGLSKKHLTTSSLIETSESIQAAAELEMAAEIELAMATKGQKGFRFITDRLSLFVLL